MYVRRKGSDVFESGDDLSFALSCPLICFVLESFLVTCSGMRVTSVHDSFSGIAPKPLEPKPSSRKLAQLIVGWEEVGGSSQTTLYFLVIFGCRA